MSPTENGNFFNKRKIAERSNFVNMLEVTGKFWPIFFNIFSSNRATNMFEINFDVLCNYNTAFSA